VIEKLACTIRLLVVMNIWHGCGFLKNNSDFGSSDGVVFLLELKLF
jgi:hypothetical protein